MDRVLQPIGGHETKSNVALSPTVTMIAGLSDPDTTVHSGSCGETTKHACSPQFLDDFPAAQTSRLQSDEHKRMSKNLSTADIPPSGHHRPHETRAGRNIHQ